LYLSKNKNECFFFPSNSPYHCPFTLVELGYKVDIFEDDYLLLAADLRIDPALRACPASSVASAYLDNAVQLNHSIERCIR
jgi:hypothetical protein